MLNPQIRGLLGIMLIVIPIVGVGFGILSITDDCSISGNVYEGIRTSTVENVEIIIDGIVRDYTESDGHFYVGGLSSGSHSIDLRKLNWDTGQLEYKMIVADGMVLDSGENRIKHWYISKTEVIDQCWVYGNVIDAITNEPIPRASVKCTGAVFGMTTTSQGRYGLIISPSGTYTVTCQKSGYITQAQEVILEDKEDLKVVFSLEPSSDMGYVAGNVYDGDTEQPINNAMISFGENYADQYTNNDGYYSYGLPTGSYSMTVFEDDYWSETRNINIIAGQTITQDFYLDSMGTHYGTVKGYVKDSSDDGIYNARLDFKATIGNYQQWYVTHTNNDGYYNIDLPMGFWSVEIDANGFEEITDSFSLTKGQTITNDYVLDISDDEEEEEDAPTRGVNWNVLFFTMMMIAIGVVFLLSCMTMNVIVLFIGFAGSALAWILYNTSIGGLF